MYSVDITSSAYVKWKHVQVPWGLITITFHSVVNSPVDRN